jgi:hypothetical protein
MRQLSLSLSQSADLQKLMNQVNQHTNKQYK